MTTAVLVAPPTGQPRPPIPPPVPTPTPTPSQRAVRGQRKRAERLPRVPAEVRAQLRAALWAAGIPLYAAAHLLEVPENTLRNLLDGTQHISSKLGWTAWPERVRTLCEQVQAANTILARHLDAAAQEVLAAGLPLPPAVFPVGRPTRTRKQSSATTSPASTASTAPSTPDTRTRAIRKRAS
jgi:hypothetical protein